ncbi:transposase [Streptomyces nigrescens]
MPLLAVAHLGGNSQESSVTLLIIMGDSPERLGNEASFVALCGVSPVEHFSRRHHFRRLHRGGRPAGQCRLHRIVQTRLRQDLRTQDYYARRIKEGKARREIIC